jgi:drug/metabolite transporter (DMT)-like permease
VPLLDALFKSKALGPRALGSVAMAIAGVAVLELGPSSSLQLTTTVAATSSLVSVGDVYCLAQALFFGIGYWRLESASVQFPDQSGRLTAGQLAAVGVGSIAYWLVADGVQPETLSQLASAIQDPFVWKALVWTGLFSTALAIYLETVALRVVSATELTVLMTSVSLWGSAFAYVFTGEVLPAIAMVGGLLILAGCVLTATEEESNATDL